MNKQVQGELFERIQALLRAGTPHMEGEESRLPVERYFSEELLRRERSALFQGLPIMVGHVSQLAEPGDYLTHHETGVPLLVLRTSRGTLAAYLNVCRHRGTKLVQDAEGRRRRAFVCPYHGWTYDEDGRLRSVPHEVGFPSKPTESVGLVPVPVAERLGLIWVLPRPGAAMDLERFLAPVEAELAGYGLEGHHVYRPETWQPVVNWKLGVEIFLEGYHLRYAHRDSIFPMFLDNLGLCDRLAPHVRFVFPKRTLAESRPDAEGWELRRHANILYLLFPNTLVLIEPDFASLISVFPVDADHSAMRFFHLLPKLPDSEKSQRFWDRNVDILLNAGKEDLAMGESIQSCVRSGANEHVRLARFEQGLRYFNEAIERAL